MGPYVRQLLAVVERYGLEHRQPGLIASIRWKIERGRLSERQAQSYLRRLQPLIQKQIDFPNYLHRPPTAEQLHQPGPPEIELGNLVEMEGVRFGRRLSEGPQHLLVAGTTGSGKTVCLRTFITRLIERTRRASKPTSFLALDFKGGDYLDIAEQLGNYCGNLNFHDGFRLAWDGPVRLPTYQWVDFISKAFAARFGLQFGATTLNRVITWTLPLLNPDGANRLSYPTPELLLEILTTAPETLFSAKGPYTQSTTQALENCIHTCGDAFKSFQGFDVIGEVIDQGKSCVIQMQNMSQPVRNFTVDLLLGRILMDRLHRQYKTDEVDIVILIDEADQLISHAISEAPWPDQSPPLTMMAKQGREMGIMLVLGASQLAGASPLILSNMHDFVFLRQADADCIRTAVNTLALPPGSEHLLLALQPGCGVFRFAGTGWPHATLGKIDFTAPRRAPVTRPYDKVAHVPAKTLQELPALQQALKKHTGEHTMRKARKKRGHNTGLAPLAEQLLKLAAGNVATPVAHLWKLTETVPAPVTQSAVCKQLTTAKLVKLVEVRIGRRTSRLIELAEAGWDYLGRPSRKLPGQGAVDTKHYLSWVAEVERRHGHQPTIEAVVPGTNHRADVLSRRGDELFSFEICCHCVDNIAGHLVSCLLHTTAVTAVIIVTPQKAMQAKIQRLIDGEPGLAAVAHRIQYETVETYMRELFG